MSHTQSLVARTFHSRAGRLSGQSAPSRTKTAFTFAEILFATMILGIGLIMVASMLPVGIKLTQTTAENATAVNITKTAENLLRSLPAASFTVTGPDTLTATMESETPGAAGVFSALSGNRIIPSDSRFAWVPFYKSTDVAGVKTVKAVVVVAKSRKSDLYSSSNLPYDLKGKSLTGVKFYDGGGVQPDTVQFDSDPLTDFGYTLVGEGAYLIVRNYATDTTINGQVYRIGRLVGSTSSPPLTTTYELLLGRDMHQSGYTVHPTAANAATLQVWVVGKQLQAPSAVASLSNLGEEAVQDVAVQELSFTVGP